MTTPQSRRVELSTPQARNVTTRTGKIIHAPAKGGYPRCSLYMYGIWYTSEPVNCPRCLGES